MKHKIIVAITGASGSIYAKVLLDQLVVLKDQIDAVGIVMSKNAKDVWEFELGNDSYKDYPFKYYEKNDWAKSISNTKNFRGSISPAQ